MPAVRIARSVIGLTMVNGWFSGSKLNVCGLWVRVRVGACACVCVCVGCVDVGRFLACCEVRVARVSGGLSVEVEGGVGGCEV